MKKEDILNKHLKKLVGRIYTSYKTLIEMQKIPEYNVVLEAMEEYAQQQVNEANTSKKECTLHNVSRLLPTLDVIDERLNNITGRATETNWQYKRAGFQDGINWALNYVTNKAKTIFSNNG